MVQEEPCLRIDKIVDLRDEHVFEAVEIDVRHGDARPQFVAFVDTAATDGQGRDAEGGPPVGEDAFLVVEDGGIVADVSADVVVHALAWADVFMDEIGDPEIELPVIVEIEKRGADAMSITIAVVGINVSIKELFRFMAALDAAFLRFVVEGHVLMVDPAEVRLEAVVGDNDVLKAVVVDVMDENGSRVGAAVDSGGFGGFVEMLSVVVVP